MHKSIITIIVTDSLMISLTKKRCTSEQCQNGKFGLLKDVY